jgi:hypothetical protein
MAWKRWLTLNPPRKKPDQERAAQFDDFVAAGLEDLWEAITAWTPGFRLNTFARVGIAGALSDIAQDWRNRSGLGGLKSDLHREIRSHPKSSADWIAALFATKYRVTRIPGQPSHQTAVEYVAEEQDLALAATWKPTSYTEGAVSDNTWFVEACEYVTTAAATEIPSPEDIEGPTSEDTKRAALGHRWPKEHGHRNLSVYESCGARGGIAHGKELPWSYRRVRIYGSPWNDRLWHHYERYTLALLKWWGRQRYAETLIAKRENTYYEVRDGQLVEPNSTPAPFESNVPTHYRGTHLAAAKLIAVVQVGSVSHSVPWVGDVMVPRNPARGEKRPPVRMPDGQESASWSYWNNCGLSKPSRTMNVYSSLEERFDERRHWRDSTSTNERKKGRAHE